MTLLEKYMKLKQSITESTEHPMIEHNGKMLHRNNSEGQPIHGTDEGIKNFHDWAGGDELKDKHGRPKVVYHGTDTNFTSVNPKKGAQGLFWVASHKEDVANSGASSTKIIKPLYVKMKKPAGWKEYDQHGLGELHQNGHGGAILPDSKDRYTGFVFDGGQVKSADKNSGKFSHNNRLND